MFCAADQLAHLRVRSALRRLSGAPRRHSGPPRNGENRRPCRCLTDKAGRGASGRRKDTIGAEGLMTMMMDDGRTDGCAAPGCEGARRGADSGHSSARDHFWDVWARSYVKRPQWLVWLSATLVNKCDWIGRVCLAPVTAPVVRRELLPRTLRVRRTACLPQQHLILAVDLHPRVTYRTFCWS